MSAKFTTIFTLFILIDTFKDKAIVCQYRDGSNDCFRLCSHRVGVKGHRFRTCVDECQYKSGLGSRFSKRPGYRARSQTDYEQDDKPQDPSDFLIDNGSQSRHSIRYFAAVDSDTTTEKAAPKSVYAFKAVPQPEHCGLRTTRDIYKVNLKNTKGLGRIYGGIDADPNEFPWIVSLQYFPENEPNNSVHVCGGSIINKNYILTAAHCMDRFVDNEKSLVIKIGINGHKLASDQDIVAMKVINHEGWDPESMVDDITLIRVKPDIKFTTTNLGKYKVNAICLPDSPSEPIGNGVISGWGELAFRSGVAAEWLQKVTVPFLERKKCHDAYVKHLKRVAPQSKVEIRPTNVCAGGKGGEDACRGDSGGPLIQTRNRQSFQVGVVSFSGPCAEYGLPSVYTNVILYMEWIYKIVLN